MTIEQVRKEYETYIEQSGVKADMSDILDDVIALESKIELLKEKIGETNNHNFVAKYIEAGVPNYHPCLINLRVQELAEYKELQEKIKQIKL